jgi:hypothetical protein
MSNGRGGKAAGVYIADVRSIWYNPLDTGYTIGYTCIMKTAISIYRLFAKEEWETGVHAA